MLDEAMPDHGLRRVSAGLDRAPLVELLTAVPSPVRPWALSLAAVQWLPGLAAIANSQRSGFGANFAAPGSYPQTFSLLSIVPYLFGGYGTIWGGVVLLALQPARGRHLPRHPADCGPGHTAPSALAQSAGRPGTADLVPGRPARVSAGTRRQHTGRAPVQRLPLYGHQRLQSRNMIDRLGRRLRALRRLVRPSRQRVPDAAALRPGHGRPPARPGGSLAIWAHSPSSLLLRLVRRQSPAGAASSTRREATLIALASASWRPLLIGGFADGRGRRGWLAAVAVFVAADIGRWPSPARLASYPSNTVLAGTTAHREATWRPDLVPEGRVRHL